MGSFTRFTRYVKDFWKVFIRGENDDLRRQTVNMEEELARLRNRRMATDKERETAALNQARHAVKKISDLHDNLLAAERAASEFASKLGEAAKSSLEAHKEMREQACKKFFIQQKQQMFTQQIVPELQSATASHSNEQDHESRVSALKTGRAAEDKDIIFGAMGADRLSEKGPTTPAVEINVERNGEGVMESTMNPVNKEEASSSASSTEAAVGTMELMDEIPPDVLAKMLEDARKQVLLEEKSHLDALSRNKAILEKEIEAREITDHASMPKGQN